MVSVFDVASYILTKTGSMTAMKLQKLVYYSQAWSLVWDDEPLFREPIQAWVNGPVVPDLYKAHKGQYLVESLKKGNPDALTDNQKDTVDSVLKHYGAKSSQWLSDLTHMEDPWKLAREGLDDGDRCEQEISHASMAEYYSGL